MKAQIIEKDDSMLVLRPFTSLRVVSEHYYKQVLQRSNEWVHQC